DCLNYRSPDDYSLHRIWPSGYRMLASTTCIEGQVSNGGAGQYFWNRLEDFKPMTEDAIEGYEKIGARAQANAVRECLRVFAPLESECRRLKHGEFASRYITSPQWFAQWMAIWNALQFRGDNPLSEYEEVSKQYRIPWIRKNVEAFVFPRED